MKDKIVFWGTDEKNADILVVLRLRASDNQVDIWTFPKAELEEEFVDKMFQDWDNINVDEFPPNFSHMEQSMTEPSLLPDTIKANNTEIVNRAEKEWYVKVLTYKLATKLQEEVEQLAEQVKSLTSFEKDAWEMAQSYWDKVNNHFQAHDITREQTSKLRDLINGAFNKLKELRKVDSAQFEQEAKANVEALFAKIDDCFEQLAASKRLNDIFENLKKIQEESKHLKLTRKMHYQVREKLNAAFLAVRNERRNMQSRRLESRIKGLNAAIGKMESSIKRDKDNLQFQYNRIENSRTSQLEMQLREAKIQMINSRIESKQAKLNDMYMTLNNLKEKLEQEQKMAAEAAAKEAEKKAKAEEAARKKQEAAEQKKAEASQQEENKEAPKIEESADKQESATPEPSAKDDQTPETEMADNATVSEAKSVVPPALAEILTAEEQESNPPVEEAKSGEEE